MNSTKITCEKFIVNPSHVVLIEKGEITALWDNISLTSALSGPVKVSGRQARQ